MQALNLEKSKTPYKRWKMVPMGSVKYAKRIFHLNDLKQYHTRLFALSMPRSKKYQMTDLLKKICLSWPTRIHLPETARDGEDSFQELQNLGHQKPLPTSSEIMIIIILYTTAKFQMVQLKKLKNLQVLI